MMHVWLCHIWYEYKGIPIVLKGKEFIAVVDKSWNVQGGQHYGAFPLYIFFKATARQHIEQSSDSQAEQIHVI